MIRKFDLNNKGRDFVVGDIHGCFDLLKEKLVEINFNWEIDRLFSVGDLVDRGEKSADCIKWINLSWFHSVRGNHEQMAIDYVNGTAEKYWYICNGGQWLVDLSEEDQKCFASLFSQLPIAIEIKTNNGLVGIIHADCPVDDWGTLNDSLRGYRQDEFIGCCLWERSRAEHNNTDGVKNISKIYFGHTPAKQVKTLGNCIFIDTGAVFGNGLTVLQI